MKPTLDIAAVCSRIGYNFNNPDHLRLALTHPSFSNDGNTAKPNNQRLEFLGDAVLGVVIAEELFRRFPHADEGELSRIRSRVVCEEALCILARKLGFNEFLLVSPSVPETREKNGALADAYESVIAAIYLDSGFEAAKRYVLHHHQELLDDPDGDWLKPDAKSKLQIWAQAQKLSTRYETTAFDPNDCLKGFNAIVYVDDKPIGSGFGHSKKDAQQNAASQALENLQV